MTISKIRKFRAPESGIFRGLLRISPSSCKGHHKPARTKGLSASHPATHHGLSSRGRRLQRIRLHHRAGVSACDDSPTVQSTIICLPGEPLPTPIYRRTVRGQKQALVQWEEGWCTMEASDPLWDTVAAIIKRGRDGRTQVRWRPTWEKAEDVHWVPDFVATHEPEDTGGAGAGDGDTGGTNVPQGGGDGGAEARVSDVLFDRSTRGSRKIRTSLVAFLSSSSRSRRTVPPGTASSTPSPAVATAAAFQPLGSPPPTRTDIDTSRCTSRSSNEVSTSLESSAPLPPAVPYLRRSSKRRRHSDPPDTDRGIISSSRSSGSSSRGKKQKHAPSEFLVPSPPTPPCTCPSETILRLVVHPCHSPSPGVRI